MNPLKSISDTIGYASQALAHPRCDLVCFMCIVIISVCYVYLTGWKAQTGVLVLSVFLAGLCLINPVLYGRENIDHVLELLEYRWGLLCCAFLMIASVCCACSIAPNVRTKILILSVFLAGLCWIVNQAAFSFNILLLSVEEGNLAQDGYSYLSDHISNKQLSYFLSPEERDAYLTNDVARFYLALIAAQRKLQIDPKILLKKPFFFGQNDISDLSDRLTYPIAYKDFCAAALAQ